VESAAEVLSVCRPVGAPEEDEQLRMIF
jgi:hypothetical protein